MDAIRNAYATGLIHPGYVELGSIEADMANSQDAVLKRFQGWVDSRIPDDVHGYLSWFSCFEKSATPPKPRVDCVRNAQQNMMKSQRT